MQLDIHGIESTVDLLKNVAPRSANNILRNTVTDVARDLAKDIKNTAPKDEGTLRKSIQAKRRKGRRDEIAASVLFRRDAKADGFYWRFIEYGTVKDPARPFVKPAVERLNARIGQVFNNSFGIRFEKEMKRLAKKVRA